ncbi:hypothetical protein [Methylobacterium symbioticum]|uniref:Uncharacterized protein n=1 Tax=Methylobacterium symbioticum TaxID=2584084 RepID=A0A509EKA0_9HYPH|nr:hypothetical protein [Methylobacterium symbioticum]VUD74588.1 hypothetical protein MET9862_05220 [Methylobacterium symbioticum]
MAESIPTTSDFVKAMVIATDQVEALLAAYGANPGAGPLPLGEGYTLDVGRSSLFAERKRAHDKPRAAAAGRAKAVRVVWRAGHAAGGSDGGDP